MDGWLRFYKFNVVVSQSCVPKEPTTVLDLSKILLYSSIQGLLTLWTQISQGLEWFPRRIKIEFAVGVAVGVQNAT